MKELPASREDILRELVSMGRLYLPEWRYSEGEYISALTDIFADMTAENRALLPAAAERCRVLYLSMYGLTQRDAVPSKGYIKVVPTSENAVHIRRGTRLGSEEHEYITTSELHASGASVKAVFCTDGRKLCRSGGNFFDLSGEDLSDAYICFSADRLLRSEGAFSCECMIYDVSRSDQHGVSPEAVINGSVRWEYLTENGFVSVEKAEYSDGKFTLHFSESVPQTEFRGESGRWLRMRYIGADMQPMYSQKSVFIKGSAEELKVQAAYFNDEKLPDGDFLPFGAVPAAYDALYIRSDECFSKSGATVTIGADMKFETISQASEPAEVQWKNVMPAAKLQPKPPLRKFIESCVWEYWNGKGWSRLFSDDGRSGDFADENKSQLKITFTCPDDIAAVTVGADEGLFVRCRIKDITRGYSDSMEYVMPRVACFTAGYDYSEGIRPDALYVSRDLGCARVEGEHRPSVSSPAGQRCTYICLDRALPVGYSSMMFDAEVSSAEGDICWEALSRDGRWFGVNVSDRTDDLRSGGIITFSLHDRMERAVLFGEEGCWLRASSAGNAELRRVGKITVDVVPVIQTARCDRMTFSYSGEPLELAQGNVFSAEISVFAEDEWRVISPEKYTLDRRTGTISFDKAFRPETSGEPNIAAEYTTTDGAAGNEPAMSIDHFLDPVPFVDSVYNPEPTFGGSDGETPGECTARGADNVRTLGRGISAGDIESIALNSEYSVHRARCIGSGDEILLVLLTEGVDNNASRLAARGISEKVSGAMPFYMRGALRVIGAERVKVNITADVTSDGEVYPQTIHADISERLSRYLDPICGGAAGNGFDIGSFPTAQDISAVILGAAHIKHIDRMQLLFESGGRLIGGENCDIPCGVPVSGEITLRIREEQIRI